MNPWLAVNRRQVRAMLRAARQRGAVRFEAFTDHGDSITSADNAAIVEALLSVDLSALVAVDADGRRWGHWQLTIGERDLVADWRFNDRTEADCEAVVDAAERVAELFEGGRA